MPQISPINWIFTIALFILAILVLKETLEGLSVTSQNLNKKSKTMKKMKW